MKFRKALALILCGALSFSLLSACSGNSGNSAGNDNSQPSQSQPDTPDAPDTPEAPSDSGALPEAYQGKKCVQLVPSMSATGLIMIMDAMAAQLETYGMSREIKDCSGDSANYITYAENAVTAGDVAVLMIAADDTEAIEEACQAAMDAGIIVLMLGANPAYEIDNMVITSYALTGYYAVKLAEDWVAYCDANGIQLTKNADGKVGTAINTRYDDQQGAKRSDAFLGEVAKSSVLYETDEKDFYVDGQVTGFEWATNVMQSKPDTRIFLCYEPDAMKGVVEAVENYCTDNSLSFDEFAVFCCYEDDLSREMYAAASADPSSTVLKGYSTYGGGPDDTGATLAQLALGRIQNEADFGYEFDYEFGYKYVDMINAFGTWNGSDPLYHWVDGEDNLAAEYE